MDENGVPGPEDYVSPEEDDYGEPCGSYDNCGCDLFGAEHMDGLCDQCS
jgi:hypothetical protein